MVRQELDSVHRFSTWMSHVTCTPEREAQEMDILESFLAPDLEKGENLALHW